MRTLLNCYWYRNEVKEDSGWDKILKNIKTQYENKFIKESVSDGISRAKILHKLSDMEKEDKLQCLNQPDPTILLDMLNPKKKSGSDSDLDDETTDTSMA